MICSCPKYPLVLCTWVDLAIQRLSPGHLNVFSAGKGHSTFVRTGAVIPFDRLLCALEAIPY